MSLVVDDVLWSRLGAPEVPSRLHWQAPGWTYDGQDRQGEFNIAGYPRQTQGHTFLVQIVLLPAHGKYPSEWSPLSTETVLPYDGGTIGDGEEIPGLGDSYQLSAVRRAVWGASADELVELLQTTPPDPRAIPFMDLSPVARFAAVGG